MITPLYAALLTILLLVLLARVIRLRWKYRVGIHDGGHAELARAIRVHGNFIETAPWVLMLMLMMELMHAPDFLLHGFGVLLLLGRMMHAWGLTHYAGSSPGRMGGMIITNTLFIVGAVACLWLSLPL